ncbi:MAG: hypothetical protein HQ592_11630 [Planctomycetes bacterium]|nr:hypothetical protein [Planctomycetota bacterium]
MGLRALATTWIAVFALTVVAWASPGAEHDGWGAQSASLHGDPTELVFSELPPLDSVTASPLAMADITASGAVALPSAPADTTSGKVAQPEGASKAITLAGPPAALLMLLQGVLCVAFVRGRRKWALLAVAVISLGRTGLNALPRLLVSGPNAANRPEASQPLVPDGQRFASESRTPDFDFVGLLRRLESEPPAFAGSSSLLDNIASHPEASLDLTQAVSGSFVSSTLAPQASSFGEAPLCGFVLRERKASLPLQPLPFSLFARPPPFST